MMSAISRVFTLTWQQVRFSVCGSRITFDLRCDFGQTTFRPGAFSFQFGTVERRRISDRVNNHPPQFRREIGHAWLAVSDWFGLFSHGLHPPSALNMIVVFQSTYNIILFRRFQIANTDIFVRYKTWKTPNNYIVAKRHRMECETMR